MTADDIEIVEAVEVPEAPKRKGRKKKAADVPVVEDAPVVEPEPEPEPEKTAETPSEAVSRIIRAEPRRKDDLPTLVEYNPHGNMRSVFLLLEVGEPTLREAWEEYRNVARTPNPDEFLSIVHTELGGSRLYSGVVPVRL